MTVMQKNRNSIFIIIGVILLLGAMLLSGCGNMENNGALIVISDYAKRDSSTIPKTSLNMEPFIEYTEPEDILFTGELKKKNRYSDHVPGIEGEVNLSRDKASVEVILDMPDTSHYEEHGQVLIGYSDTAVATIYGYYTKEGDNYVRKQTVTSRNIFEPVLLEIELPEGADEFIGVRAEILVEGQSQTWSPDADAEDTDPVSKPIVEYLYLERCRGKVEVNGK